VLHAPRLHAAHERRLELDRALGLTK
jgi:hypothetical protein